MRRVEWKHNETYREFLDRVGIKPDYAFDLSRVARAIALQIGWQTFETKRGNSLLSELQDTRWNWLNVYRLEAGESSDMYLGRTEL